MSDASNAAGNALRKCGPRGVQCGSADDPAVVGMHCRTWLYRDPMERNHAGDNCVATSCNHHGHIDDMAPDIKEKPKLGVVSSMWDRMYGYELGN